MESNDMGSSGEDSLNGALATIFRRSLEADAILREKVQDIISEIDSTKPAIDCAGTHKNFWVGCPYCNLDAMKMANDGFQRENSNLRVCRDELIVEVRGLSKALAETQEELEEARRANVLTAIELPEIPEGYELNMVGTLCTIAPIETNEDNGSRTP